VGKLLSIIIPCFNEESTILYILERIKSVSLKYKVQKEIIVVNDASTDKTCELVKAFIEENPSVQIKIRHHKFNSGKGAAIRTGISVATGDFIIIQDADTEYDPKDYNKLLQPICEGYADVVYGSRFIGTGPHRVLFFFHTIGNKFLTLLSNCFTQLNLTDMETGYKLIKVDVLKQITLKENRFGFEPEITAKISRIKNIRIYEVGIAYYGRTYSEGKKVNWKDGFRAIYCILKYNLITKR
jgi:glycosyltransferase involved in cell wall biosynthesis